MILKSEVLKNTTAHTNQTCKQLESAYILLISVKNKQTKKHVWLNLGTHRQGKAGL